ncbi:hypothetical protein [Streptomyces sp. NPDC001292]|uniref:hypothetical protein n=1 Tax=Streptomyces sp. NPDC001292 TaxID=3364558 RepID=UPI0036C2CA7A
MAPDHVIDVEPADDQGEIITLECGSVGRWGAPVRPARRARRARRAAARLLAAADSRNVLTAARMPAPTRPTVSRRPPGSRNERRRSPHAIL